MYTDKSVTNTTDWRSQNELDWISILSGTLDEPELAPPEGHYGVESWISWLKIEDDLKKEHTEGN